MPTAFLFVALPLSYPERAREVTTAGRNGFAEIGEPVARQPPVFAGLRRYFTVFGVSSGGGS